ncbi:hypothetical protein BGZ47_007523 [Haplosporangium gracile]|nr:hypothetical protein BGZ47_007523 [Haplosporangium gracile]
MSILTPDMGYFDNALRIVNIALHGRINHTAQTSLANDILCVAAGLRSAALIEQLYLNPNDIERIQSMFHHGPITSSSSIDNSSSKTSTNTSLIPNTASTVSLSTSTTSSPSPRSCQEDDMNRWTST